MRERTRRRRHVLPQHLRLRVHLDPQEAGEDGRASQTSVSSSRVFAGVFAATTVAFAGVAYVLYNKAHRANVDLAGGGGGALA